MVIRAVSGLVLGDQKGQELTAFDGTGYGGVAEVNALGQQGCFLLIGSGVGFLGPAIGHVRHVDPSWVALDLVTAREDRGHSNDNKR